MPYPPPDLHTPSPFPEPPTRRRWPLLTVSIVAVLLVVAGVAGALLATGVVDLAGAKEKPPKPKPEDHTYGFVDNLCERTPFEDIESTFAPISGDTTEGFSEYDGFGTQSCSAQLYDSMTETFGNVRVDVWVYAKASDARELFDPEGGFPGSEIRDFDGDWQRGAAATMVLDGGTTNHGVIILDGNLHLSVTAIVAEHEVDDTEASTAFTGVLTELLEPLRDSTAIKAPPGTGSPGQNKTGEYDLVDDLCERVDWSSLDDFPFTSLDASEYSEDVDQKGTTEERCDNGSFDDTALKSNAALIFRVNTFTSPDAAGEEYKRLRDSIETSSSSVSDAEGDWEQGKLGESDGPIRIEAGIVIVDDNLVANLALAYNGDKGSMDAATAALSDLAGQIVTLHNE